MDAGALGVSLVGRAALAEGGEKIAAAARLCELQASGMCFSEKLTRQAEKRASALPPPLPL